MLFDMLMLHRHLCMHACPLRAVHVCVWVPGQVMCAVGTVLAHSLFILLPLPML